VAYRQLSWIHSAKREHGQLVVLGIGPRCYDCRAKLHGHCAVHLDAGFLPIEEISEEQFKQVRRPVWDA
jgi:hypothetical protein